MSVDKAREGGGRDAASAAQISSQVVSRRAREDLFFRAITRFTAIFLLLVLIAIGVVLWREGWDAFRTFGFGFLWSTAWNPVTNQYGALIFIFGTLVTSLLAMIMAVPVSFGIALFTSELAPYWLRQPISSAIELLAGIPSIIFGMWGLLVFAPVFGNMEPWINDHLGKIPGIGLLFQGPPMGIGMLTAGIVLGIMIIPFISAIMRDVFLSTPGILKESAYALGGTTWEVMRHVILPFTRSAVVGGIFLGLGRALGETMAVTFVIGNTDSLSASLLMPGNSIAAALANEFTEATTHLYKSSLLALGFILFVVSFLVLVLAKFMLWRMEKRIGGGAL